MRSRSLTILVIFMFISSSSIFAQEKKVQTAQKIELPQLNLEQKLDRAVMNLSAFIIGGIAHAKSMGKTPEDYGKFIGEIFAPGWEETKGKSIAEYIENMYKNFQADKNCQWEILEESDKMVKVRMKRFGNTAVKAYERTGVTPQEYDRCMSKIMQTITNYLGFYYNQGLQDDWIIFWISTEKEIIQN